MAEYTGFARGGLYNNEARYYMAGRLKLAALKPSLAYAFAYETGPAYGLLLDMQGEDWRKDLSFTMNIDNLFDAEPPVYKASSSNGTANGSTLGRLIQFGVHKDF